MYGVQNNGTMRWLFSYKSIKVPGRPQGHAPITTRAVIFQRDRNKMTQNNVTKRHNKQESHVLFQRN